MSEDARCVEGHTAMIYDRGGRQKWRQLSSLASVEWARERDAFSAATVKLSGAPCRAQADVINLIQPHRHELVIFRGDERVWEGSVIEVQTLGDTATIIAHDAPGAYLRGTPLTADYGPLTGEPVSEHSALMTERVWYIIDRELTEPYEMQVGTGSASRTVTVPRWEGIDPPANILPFLDVRRSETLLTRSDTQAFQMNVADHIEALAEGGLDFTTVGRRLVLWDSAEPLGRTRTLTEADFTGEPQVYLSGSEHAVISHISASRDENGELEEGEEPPPSVGHAGEPHPYYGVWTRVVSLSSEEGSDTPTQDALNSQAQRDLVGRNPVPVTIRLPEGASLMLSATLTATHLVPGVIMPVRATLNIRQIQQDQRLDKVTVTETAEGETIAVSLSAWGQAVLV